MNTAAEEEVAKQDTQLSEGHEKVDEGELSRKENNELKIRMFTLDETMYWGREGTPSVIQCSQVPPMGPRRCFRHGGEHNESFDRLVKTLLDHAVVIGQQPSDDIACDLGKDSGLEPMNDLIDQSSSVATEIIQDSGCETQNALVEQPLGIAYEGTQDIGCETIQQSWYDPSDVSWKNFQGGSWWGEDNDLIGQSSGIASESGMDSGRCVSQDNLVDHPSVVVFEIVQPFCVVCESDQNAGLLTRDNIDGRSGTVNEDAGQPSSVECESCQDSWSVTENNSGISCPAVDELRPMVEKLINDKIDEICCSCVDDYCNTEGINYIINLSSF